MPSVIDELCYQLALANRIVAHEGVLDGFGHISVRHPEKPDHYLLVALAQPGAGRADAISSSSTLDSEVLTPGDLLPYGECVIHGEIFRARPDVNGVVPSPFAGDPAVLCHRLKARADHGARRDHGRDGADRGTATTSSATRRWC